jgi:hypothetical protein
MAPPPPQTYRAILQGSQIIWLDTPPNLPPATEVYVAILAVPAKQHAQATPKEPQGQAMAAALEKLAQLNPFHEIDPVVWQRETRQDPALPGRE